MAIFRMLFMVALLAGVAGVVFFFSPDEIKEKGLSYIGGNPYIPSEIKKIAEDIYATPAIKRKKLIEELKSNFAAIQSIVEKSSPGDEATKKLIARSEEIIEQVALQNSDPTVIKQITDAVATKILSSGNACVPQK